MIKIIICFLFTVNAYGFQFYTVDLPPFSYVKGKSISGPMFEIAKLTCEQTKLDCSFHTAPWKRIMKGVKDGDIEACYVYGKNKLRKSWSYFSPPIVSSEYGFLYHESYQKPLKSYQDLKDKIIVVHEKSNTHKKIIELQKTYPNFKIQTGIDIQTILKMVANKRFSTNTYLYGNKDILLYLAKQSKFEFMKYSLKDQVVNYHFGFSKASISREKFLKFNSALTKNLKSKKFKQIYKKFNVSPGI